MSALNGFLATVLFLPGIFVEYKNPWGTTADAKPPQEYLDKMNAENQDEEGGEHSDNNSEVSNVKSRKSSMSSTSSDILKFEGQAASDIEEGSQNGKF